MCSAYDEFKSKFYNKMSNSFYLLQSNWSEVVEKFDDMGLKEKLLRGIYAYGWVYAQFCRQLLADSIEYNKVHWI